MHVGRANVEMFRHPLLNFLDGDAPVIGAQQIVQHFLSGLQCHIAADQLGMSNHPVQRAFEITHVRGDLMGEEFHDAAGNLDFRLLGLGFQDAKP